MSIPCDVYDAINAFAVASALADEDRGQAARVDLVAAIAAHIAEIAAEASAAIRAIDEAMVVRHLGVFNAGDDPKKALNDIMATDGDYSWAFKDRRILLAEIDRLRGLLAEPSEAMVEAAARKHWALIAAGLEWPVKVNPDLCDVLLTEMRAALVAALNEVK